MLTRATGLPPKPAWNALYALYASWQSRTLDDVKAGRIATSRADYLATLRRLSAEERERWFRLAVWEAGEPQARNREDYSLEEPRCATFFRSRSVPSMAKRGQGTVWRDRNRDNPSAGVHVAHWVAPHTPRHPHLVPSYAAIHHGAGTSERAGTALRMPGRGFESRPCYRDESPLSQWLSGLWLAADRQCGRVQRDATRRRSPARYPSLPPAFSPPIEARQIPAPG